ncbi:MULTISPECIES: FAD-dependent oxidoreductase [Mesorhizobium]|uniref:FAD-dependent oxidoreductase n=1 Tax=Mesorhizobium TaxID=68287 RepID=UPI000BAFE49D|nr:MULTISPECIES: FAD-dependent oxidoreductase [Mesorhizobium]PBB58180.1 amino acid dehydrogenase [Mesorhizobium loti]PBB83385.1 amino acid dehydrogenase [Mesorhizobium sp. WSM3876]
MSRVLVLGAGVVGMTSAYALAKKGHDVCVVDAAPGPAEAGASFGNGGQLSYFYTDAMASPSVVVNLPKYILGLDPAFRVSLTTSPRFLAWGLRFLANATQRAFERNTIDILELALQSRAGIAELSTKVQFDYSKAGKITLFSCQEDLVKAAGLSELKNRYGADQVILTREQALEREPALAHYGHSFIGAIWSPHDEAGDSSLFCINLRDLLERDYGVKFMFDTTIRRINTQANKMVGVETQTDELECARAVVSLGAWTAPIARTAGISLPIWPVRGYSLTVPALTSAPVVSVTDTARKTVFCRIGDRLRVAGLADIGPAKRNLREDRFGTLLTTAKGIFPKAGDYDGEVKPWTGLRPVTPDSKPIVGATSVKGLYLNCGHGSLGWTLSMATANKLANLVY